VFQQGDESATRGEIIAAGGFVEGANDQSLSIVRVAGGA
jgi:hypothetical protein